MFKKKNVCCSEIDTIIGINSTFDGNIQSSGTIRVDGKFNGDILTTGDVFVGMTALIKGNISADNIHLSGRIDGNINSKGVLRLFSTAKLYGDIHVTSFVADEGGIFQGNCSMIESPEPDLSRDQQVNSKKSDKSKDYKKSAVLE